MASFMIRPALASLVLAIGIPAQTVWVVDANGGPGSTFATVGSAVAAASDGDVVQVRIGSYSETIRTSKALTFLLADGTYLYELSSLNLPAGRTFQVRGGSFYNVQVYAAAGTVHVEDVFVAYPGSFDLRDSSGVTVRDSTFGRSARVTNSTVAFSGCYMDGYDFTVALSCISADVSVANCTILGAYELCGTSQPASPAIRLTSSRVAITRSVVSAGDGSSCTGPTSAIQDAGAPFSPSTVMLDASAKVTGSNGAPPIAGAAVTAALIPSTRTSSDEAGTRLDLVAEAAAGTPVFVLASLPVLPVPTPFGNLWLDPSLQLTLVAGTTGPSGELAVSFVLPAGLPVAANLVTQTIAAVPLAIGTPSRWLAP